MKCNQKNCDGEYRVITTYHVARGDVRKRHRKCDKCGFEDYTIEMSSKEYERMRRLIVGLKVLLKEYLA